MIYSEEKRQRLLQKYTPDKRYVILEVLWSLMQTYQDDVMIEASRVGCCDTELFEKDYRRMEEIKEKACVFLSKGELPPFDEYIAMYEEARTMVEKYQKMVL